MKRDLELIRKMVLELDDSPPGWGPDMKFPGYTEAEIGYHAYLLIDAGLARGRDASVLAAEAPFGFITHLTQGGHEFAEAVKTEARWRKALSIVKVVKDKGESVSLGSLARLMDDLRKEE